MRRSLLMPKIGLTMTEGLLAEWVVQAGQAFSQGDVLYVVETDKVANEITAEGSGTLDSIQVPAGETVVVGTVVGWWEDGQAGKTATVATQAASATNRAKPVERIIASPLVRRLAVTHHIDLSTITGSGPRGRIVARDLPAFPTRVAASIEHTPPTVASTADADGVQRITPTPWQASMARRLTQSKQATPHFYLTLEAEVSRLIALRQELNHAGDTHLTLNLFIVQAVNRALRRHPWANRVWHDGHILAFDRIHIGVAVQTPQGLVSPVISDVAELGLGVLARRLDATVTRVRAHGLQAQDNAPAAITVSNVGMHQVTYVGSIIPPGQAMILGVGSIKPVFRPDANKQPVLRQELGLVLSADHRILDGVRALEFLHTVQQLLENPTQLMLD